MIQRESGKLMICRYGLLENSVLLIPVETVSGGGKGHAVV